MRTQLFLRHKGIPPNYSPRNALIHTKALCWGRQSSLHVEIGYHFSPLTTCSKIRSHNKHLSSARLTMADHSCAIHHPLSAQNIAVKHYWFVNSDISFFLILFFFGIVSIIFLWTNSAFLLPLQLEQVGRLPCPCSSGSSAAAPPHFCELTRPPHPLLPPRGACVAFAGFVCADLTLS